MEKHLKILNLTQHDGTPEQVEQGLYEPAHKEEIKNLLTFSAYDIQVGLIRARAWELAKMASEIVNTEELSPFVLIGGLPALMGPLVAALRARGLTPMFAHSDRVKEDQPQADGSVKTVGVFKHQFFYPAP